MTQKINTDERAIQSVLSRGVVEVIDRDSLQNRLLFGEKLRIKLGIDPTSPNIHIGRAALLLKLKDFQDLGHQVVFIVGDATGVIGDSSDKETERPMLTEDVVKNNMQSYLEQAFKILDPEKTETHHNSEWISKLGFFDLAKMANLFGLHEFASRDVIARRMEKGERVSTHELLYPLLQGYDSVMVRADVELGGTDQRFNLLTGRRIQPLYDQKPQDIVMLELLLGTDGRKMSSSWGNTVNLLDNPTDMYGKIMRIPDAQVRSYFVSCTRVSEDEIAHLLEGEHPKKVKERLAWEITALCHGKEGADIAGENFKAQISGDTVPEHATTLTTKTGALLRDVLVDGGIVASNSEFRRLIESGAIENIETGATITEENMEVAGTLNVRVGKKRFVSINVQ